VVSREREDDGGRNAIMEEKGKKKARLTAGLLVLVVFALGNDCGPQSRAKVFRKLVQLLVAVDLDRALSCVADHKAVVTPLKVLFQLGFCAGVDDTVEIIG